MGPGRLVRSSFGGLWETHRVSFVDWLGSRECDDRYKRLLSVCLLMCLGL